MPHRSSWMIVPLLAICGGAGCGGAGGASAGPEAATKAAEAADRPPGEVEVQPAEPAVAVAFGCTPGAAERCDALDQDCDGAIDETCAYPVRPVQVVAAWNSAADVDLRVVDPQGEPLALPRRRSASGGRLDQAGRGGCAPGAHDRLESLGWGADLPPGVYRVAAQRRNVCGAPADVPTTVSVSVAIQGHVHGPYNVQLADAEPRQVLSFTIP